MPSKAPGDGTVDANTYSINVSNSGSVFKFDCFFHVAGVQVCTPSRSEMGWGRSVHLFSLLAACNS